MGTLNAEQLNYYEMSMKSLNGDYTNNNYHQLKMFGPEGSVEVMYNNYWVPGNIVTDAYYVAPTESMTGMLPTLNKKQVESYTKVILDGNAAEFDQFVENWNALGGEDITEEVNEWNASK